MHGHCNTSIINEAIYLVIVFIVTCDPPCVQGACVANDTCNCAEGYIGERCEEPGTMCSLRLYMRISVSISN